MATTRFRRFCLAGLVAVLLIGWGFDRMAWMDWVGFTDLEIEFVITEAPTGQPVGGANIAISSEDGHDLDKEKLIQLETDRTGSTRWVCHTLCSGSVSGLAITRSYAVDLPWSFFQVSAPGYHPSEWAFLHTPEYARQVQRIGRGSDKLLLRVSLRKTASDPPQDKK